jgi:hypothetical protein
MKEQGETVLAAVVLESIGFYTDKRNSQRYPPLIGLFYPNRGNFIAVIGNFASRKVLKMTVRVFKQSSDFPVSSLTAPGRIPGIDFSDHWSFWQHGYPAVMVTDTAYMRNKNYHQPADLPETLDYRKMAEVVRGLEAAVRSLAESEGL